MSDDRRGLARKTVDREMTRQGVNNVGLAERAHVDAKTVNDFLSGKRWPQRTTRSAIAVALGWPGDEIDRIAETGQVSVSHDAGRKVGADDNGEPVVRSLLGYPLDAEYYRQVGRREIVLQMITPEKLDDATTLGMQAMLSTVMTPEIRQIADGISNSMDAHLRAVADEDEIDAQDEAEQAEESP